MKALFVIMEGIVCAGLIYLTKDANIEALRLSCIVLVIGGGIASTILYFKKK